MDGQHPHDFFMELAALYDYKFGEKTMLSFYAAPVGDPAMGPRPIHTVHLHRKIPSLLWVITFKTRRISQTIS